MRATNRQGNMVFTFLVFLHLIATCAAIGTIVVTDMRLVARLVRYRAVIPRPERFETGVVMLALLLLYVTGGVLVTMGMAERPDYLANGKLQGKLVLVGMLTLNAFLLHFRTFPILGLARTISGWTRGQWLTVAGSVSLSNSLWFYCAFLGVARPWNFQVTVWFVLGTAVAVWAGVYLVTNLVLLLGSRDRPRRTPDWVDATIAAWGELARRAPASGTSAHGSAFDPRLNPPPDGSGGADRRIPRPVHRRGRRG